MSWQDIVLTIGNLVFIVALIPSILSKDKPHLLTSLTNATVLFVIALVYSTLHLYLSGVVLVVTGSLWLTLAWQKYAKSKAK